MTFKQIRPQDLAAYEQLLTLLCENFYEDPLYDYIFENQHTRMACLDIFFKAYLKYLEPSAKFYLSDDSKACGVIFLSEKMPTTFQNSLLTARFVLELTALTKKVGIKGFVKCLKTIQKMSSKWIDEVVDSEYIHLDLMVVSKELRGKGYFKKWFSQVQLDHEESYVFTLETQNIENLHKYQKCGFTCAKTIPLENTELTQYGMIYETKVRD